jgi:hypothetical protein
MTRSSRHRIRSSCVSNIVGFTVRRIAPVYNRLLDTRLSPESAEAAELLERWWYLHHVRTILGTLAFVIASSSK